MRLDGKVALVTGAGRNIGQAIATLFAAEGAKVIVATGSNGNAVQETARLCRDKGAEVLAVTGDVASAAAVKAMVRQGLERFGRIDVLASTVAIRPRVPFLECTLEQWQRVLDVNLGGTFNLCQAVLPGMIEQRSGSIITFGGLNAMTAGGAGANSAAKMALLGLTRALAVDMAPYNVRVNMIVPGRIDTIGREGTTAEDIPMQRRGSTDEIARATLFLASDDSAYVTGDRIMVTGGRSNL